MKTYTREQLLKAQTEYNKRYREDPDGFTDNYGEQSDSEIAEQQINYLLNLVV